MKKKRILIVDDEAAFSTLLTILLRGEGRYEVRVENDSLMAHRAAKEFQPDILLLDIIMPGLTGQELRAILREDKDLQDTPIIFITALASGSRGEDDIPFWPDRKEVVMGKPVECDELVSRIDKQLVARAG